jgi:hypothetical protein
VCFMVVPASWFWCMCLLVLLTDRNSLFHPLGSLPAEGPGSVGVRMRRIVRMISVAWSDIGSFIISRRLGCRFTSISSAGNYRSPMPSK